MSRFNTHVPQSIRDAWQARHEPEAQRMLATMYWSFLVVLCALMLCGAVAYGAWEFTQPLITDVDESVSVGARKVLTKPELQKVLEGLDARVEEYDARRAAPIPVKDPS